MPIQIFQENTIISNKKNKRGDKNKNNMKKIRLWKNRKELSDQYSIVDDEDYERVKEAVCSYCKDGTLRKGSGKWYSHVPCGTKPYALNGDRDKSIHRIVMNAPKGMDVDHINGDPLDNRRENLRLVTNQQNQWNTGPRVNNTSGYKGDAWNKRNKKWQAQVRYTCEETGKNCLKYLGLYGDKEEAREAYDRWVIANCDEFAYLNFPREDYE